MWAKHTDTAVLADQVSNAVNDRVHASRRHKGPHSTASVLRRDVRVLGFVRHSRTQIGQVDYANQRRSVIAM